MKNIFILGGVSYDSIITFTHLPNLASTNLYPISFHETVGSTGAGKALNLAKLGLKTTLHGIIGKDEYGQKIKDVLEKHHIEFLYHEVEKTERHTNIMDSIGNRASIYTTQLPFELDYDKTMIENPIKNADVIVLNIINYTKELIPLIKKYHKHIWTDLHDYDGLNSYHKDFIDAATHIHLSSEQLPNYKEFMLDLINQGKELVICTHGKKGATAITKDRMFYEVPIIDTYPFVDSNGAGDSFFSGFLYGYLNHRSISDCLKYGTITSGLCITSNELANEDLDEDLLLTEYQKHYEKRG